MKNYYNLSWKNVLDELDADEIKGLTKDEVDIRAEMYGDNYVVYGEKRVVLTNAMKTIMSPWALILLIMISICFYAGEEIAAFYFFGLFLCISGVVLWNKREPMKIKKHLENLNKSSALVMRDGIKQKVRIGELVVGDIVYLNKGMFVPADMRIISSEKLFVNELAVTGENYPTEKFSEKIDENNPEITSMKNMVFRSTVVAKGNGVGVVVATGMDSEIGKLIKAVFFKDDSYKEEFSAEGLFNVVSFGALLISLFFFAIRLLKGYGDAAFDMMIKDMLSINISWIVVMYIVSIYMNMRKLKKDDVIVNDIGVLYRLKDINTFLMDKYGMLTSIFYYVSEVFVDDEILTVNTIERDRESVSKLKRINEITTKCCTFFEEEDYPLKNRGLKTEFSILRFIFNTDKSMISYKTTRNNKMEIPFDRERNMKTSLIKVDKKTYRACTIGEIDKILNKCVSRRVEGAEITMTNEELEKIKKASYRMAKDGCRIVAAAYRNYNYLPSADENIESNFVFVGMWGVRESFQNESGEIVKALRESDTRVILNCQENKVAATSIGRELNMIDEGVTAVSGLEMDYLTKVETAKILNTCNVYSNITPKQKEGFVSILRDRGRKILAVGSKLKDISFLHRCNLRVAYGENASEILKSWSDIYIPSGNIKSILKVFGHGIKCREKFRTMVNYITFLMTYTVFMSLFNVINDIGITHGSIFISIFGVLISGFMINFGDMDVEKESKEDNRGKYLFSGAVLSACICIFAVIVKRFLEVDMGDTSKIVNLLIPSLSFFVIVPIREFLDKFKLVLLFFVEILMILSVMFLGIGKELLQIGTSNGVIVLIVGWVIVIMMSMKIYMTIFMREKRK